MIYRCPDFDPTVLDLKQSDFLERWRSTPEPERFAMVEDDNLRRAMFDGFLREREKRGMGHAEVDFEKRYP